jgi:hypothetical protein
MPLWLAIGIGLWVFSIVAAIALCRAAARGARPDRADPAYPDPSSGSASACAAELGRSSGRASNFKDTTESESTT